MGHHTALSAVEEFGLVDALHPGRFDLGLGRWGRPAVPPSARGQRPRPSAVGRTPDGLVVPAGLPRRDY